MRPKFRPGVERLETLQLLSNVSLTLSADQSHYAPGTPAQLTLTVTDVGSQNVTFDEGPSGDGFNVSQGSSTVWRSNAGINAMFLREVTLTPGQSTTIQATWDGHPNDGAGDPSTALPTGTFQVQSQVSIDGTTAAPLTIAVGKAPTTTTTTTTTTGSGTVTPVTLPMIPVQVGTKNARAEILLARLARQHARVEAFMAAHPLPGHAAKPG